MGKTAAVAVGEVIRFARPDDTRHFELFRDPVSGALQLRGFDTDGAQPVQNVRDSWDDTNGWRMVAANTDPVLTQNDKTVELQSTDTSTVVISTSAALPPGIGKSITLALVVRGSTGSFTLAATRGATAGTITLDAVGEGAIVTRNNAGVWKLISLLGGATFA